jgi:hypothetical protein
MPQPCPRAPRPASMASQSRSTAFLSSAGHSLGAGARLSESLSCCASLQSYLHKGMKSHGECRAGNICVSGSTFSALCAWFGLIDAVQAIAESQSSLDGSLLRRISYLAISIHSSANVDTTLELAIRCDDDAMIATGCMAVTLQLVLCWHVRARTGWLRRRGSIHSRHRSNDVCVFGQKLTTPPNLVLRPYVEPLYRNSRTWEGSGN